jgi:tRNA G37 N-methylase TrmD
LLNTIALLLHFILIATGVYFGILGESVMIANMTFFLLWLSAGSTILYVLLGGRMPAPNVVDAVLVTVQGVGVAFILAAHAYFPTAAVVIIAYLFGNHARMQALRDKRIVAAVRGLREAVDREFGGAKEDPTAKRKVEPESMGYAIPPKAL